MLYKCFPIKRNEQLKTQLQAWYWLSKVVWRQTALQRVYLCCSLLIFHFFDQTLPLAFVEELNCHEGTLHLAIDVKRRSIFFTSRSRQSKWVRRTILLSTRPSTFYDKLLHYCRVIDARGKKIPVVKQIAISVEVEIFSIELKEKQQDEHPWAGWWEVIQFIVRSTHLIKMVFLLFFERFASNYTLRDGEQLPRKFIDFLLLPKDKYRWRWKITWTFLWADALLPRRQTQQHGHCQHWDTDAYLITVCQYESPLIDK